MLRKRAYSCPAYIHTAPLSDLTVQNLKIHDELYNCGSINNHLAMHLQEFIRAQIELVERESLLSDYNYAQQQSTVVLEAGSPSYPDLIAETINESACSRSSEELRDQYNKEKTDLILQGLRITGALLPFVFSLPLPVKKEQTDQHHRRQRRFSTASMIPDKFKVVLTRRNKKKEPVLSLVAYRYPKTVDVHTLRSSAIKLLVNLCPYYVDTT